MEGNLFINQDTLAYCVFGATFLSGGLGEQMLNRLYNNIEILTRLYNNNIEMKLTRLFQSGCKARGTTTNRVTRYSESITKCSFLTKEMDSACHPGNFLLLCLLTWQENVCCVSGLTWQDQQHFWWRDSPSASSLCSAVFFLVEECRLFIQNQPQNFTVSFWTGKFAPIQSKYTYSEFAPI